MRIALLWRVSQTMRWVPFVVLTVIGYSSLVVFARPSANALRPVEGYHILAVCLAVASSFAFDGQVVEFEGATPTSTRGVIAARAIVSGIAVACVWFVGLALSFAVLATLPPGYAGSLPLGLAVELFALVVLGWVFGLEGARLVDLGGLLGGVAVSVASALSVLIGRRYPMFASAPPDPTWLQSRDRWLIVAAAAIVAALLRKSWKKF